MRTAGALQPRLRRRICPVVYSRLRAEGKIAKVLVFVRSPLGIPGALPSPERGPFRVQEKLLESEAQ
jgi:hypothetical protein